MNQNIVVVIILAAAFAVLVLALIKTIAAWKSHNKSLKEALTNCPQCGGEVTVTADPFNSRFFAQCRNSECGCSFSHPVRASALSLWGILQNTATLSCGVIAYRYVQGAARGYEVAAVAASLLVGWAIVRFVLRLTAYTLLRSSAPLISKEEIIAYLALPQFVRGSQKEEASQQGTVRGMATSYFIDGKEAQGDDYVRAIDALPSDDPDDFFVRIPGKETLMVANMPGGFNVTFEQLDGSTWVSPVLVREQVIDLIGLYLSGNDAWRAGLNWEQLTISTRDAWRRTLRIVLIGAIVVALAKGLVRLFTK